MHNTSSCPSIRFTTSNHGPSFTEQARTSNRSPPPINHHSDERVCTATNTQNNWRHGEDEGTMRETVYGSSKGGTLQETVTAPLGWGKHAEVGVHSEVGLTLPNIHGYQVSKGGNGQPVMLCERVCWNPSNGRLQHQRSAMRTTHQRLQNLFCPSGIDTTAQPATIIPNEFVITTHFFISP